MRSLLCVVMVLVAMLSFSGLPVLGANMAPDFEMSGYIGMGTNGSGNYNCQEWSDHTQLNVWIQSKCKITGIWNGGIQVDSENPENFWFSMNVNYDLGAKPTGKPGKSAYYGNENISTSLQTQDQWTSVWNGWDKDGNPIYTYEPQSSVNFNLYGQAAISSISTYFSKWWDSYYLRNVGCLSLNGNGIFVDNGTMTGDEIGKGLVEQGFATYITTSVPEPATLGFLVIGALGFIRRRR